MDNKELKRAELTCARVPNDVSEPCAKENTENCERARQPSDRFCRPPAGATRDCAVSRVARLAQGSRASLWLAGGHCQARAEKDEGQKMSRTADRSRSSASRQRRHHRRLVNGRVVSRSSAQMSAIGGKADMPFALHMSAFDPKRT